MATKVKCAMLCGLYVLLGVRVLTRTRVRFTEHACFPRDALGSGNASGTTAHDDYRVRS